MADPLASPVPGQVRQVAPGLRQVLAPNPSPMTLQGTNTWIIGQGRVAVIDPGPALPAHLAAILAALGPGETVSHILVTHAHLDHSPLARPLAEATGAPVLAFGDALAGRSAVMAQLAASGAGGGGEGVDAGFAPDEVLADGAEVAGAGWQLTALHTPGHFGNHLSFAWGERLFTGDQVMSWSSSLISPPDGDVAQYLASLDRLAGLGARIAHSGHGPDIADPAARIAELAAHRRQREAEVLAALAGAPADAATLAARIYTATPPALLAAAARNVLAHLIDLSEHGLIAPQGALNAGAVFERG
ncbi:MBL fold metallo-hydrolase [Frigidibacter mobilis]|uniref:Metallo-beta-lactamase family protein n=1 Tax=Frigidibacter mobilis TaxID=1335048 RepID=A0A159Z1L1_9RHOB|nr:MBL fold metallo-hydrolase [Frigidibacter mobilis]AMY68827.1 metallo-beta-lactamase family protein [Frigidibacter mobilis]